MEFKKKHRYAMTAALKEDKNPKFLAISHSEIMLEKEHYKGNKKIPVRFTIVDILCHGWSKVPNSSKQKSANTKKISEMVTGDDGMKTMKMWSYLKAAINMDRGERVDETVWIIHIGDTFILWLDEARARDLKEQSQLSENITELSLCEIEMQSRNNEQAIKGSGVKIQTVRPCAFSLYSCLKTLELSMPKTLATARIQAMQHQQENAFINKDLQTDQVGFFVHISSKAIIDDDMCKELSMIHIVNSEEHDVIDIPVNILKKYTNVDNVQEACQLLEVAIALDALNVLVINNDFLRSVNTSSLRGIPLIDTEKFFYAVDHTKFLTQTVFPTSMTSVIEDVEYKIEIEIDPEPTSVYDDDARLPASDDLVIAGKGAELQKAYKFKVHYRGAEQSIPNMFVGYYNASPLAASVVSGFKRRKVTPLLDHD